MSGSASFRPLVAHVVYSFHVGGLENGVVNLLNHLPEERYRHVVIALADCSQQFCQRVKRRDVEFISLHKPPGHGVLVYRRLFELFRGLKPQIVHTRNLAALEMAVPARVAGVPVRVHGEHGWDTTDPGGTRRKYRLLRRIYSPFVTHYVALSRQLSSYLTERVRISESRVSRICNGVDTARFTPAGMRRPIAGSPFNDPQLWVVGTVGRLQAVKDQLTLVRAFSAWLAQDPEAAARARLAVVGDGPLRREVEHEIAASGIEDKVWLAGERSDVPEVMRGLDCFVLSSQAEGISNTLLEAMASGLPTVATDVGGNAELVVDGEVGYLVAPMAPAAMAECLAHCFHRPAVARELGKHARQRVECEFSLDGMVQAYVDLYDGLLTGCEPRRLETRAVRLR